MDRRSLREFEQLEQDLNNADSGNSGNMLTVKRLIKPPKNPYRSSMIGNVIHNEAQPDDLHFKFGRMSSLNEFERLEQDLISADSESTDKLTPGSEDKVEISMAKNVKHNNTKPDVKHTSTEFNAKDFDLLRDFEHMEDACQQLVLIKRRSEEQENTLYQVDETNNEHR